MKPCSPHTTNIVRYDNSSMPYTNECEVSGRLASHDLQQWDVLRRKKKGVVAASCMVFLKRFNHVNNPPPPP